MKLLLSLLLSLATTPSQVFAKGAKSGVNYTNPVDDSITIHNITALPTIDNVDGIFARPFDKKIIELIQKDHQWELVTSNFVGNILTPDELIKSPKKVKRISRSINADAILITEVRKNPKNLVLSLNLFSAKDGRLISQLITPSLSQASTEKATEQLIDLYRDLKSKIPYDGLILSRTQSRVTLNLGKSDGLNPGQTLNISKIVSAKRHPKLGFIMSHEKALLGKVRIVKVDKALSFADIVTESEKGAVQKDSKITGAKPLSYKPPSWIKKAYLPTEMAISENNNKLIGGSENWKPELPPSFGRVSASVGIGPYKYSLGLADATGKTLNSKAAIYPSVNISGEMWINPEWYVVASINQGTADIANPVDGPDLSASSGHYTLDAGYNLLLYNDFWNSKLTAAIGYASYNMTLDQTADGLTSTKYSSLRITLGGRTPIDTEKRWFLGANLYWYLSPNLTEKPLNSGSSKNRIVHFAFMCDYRWSERIWLNSELDFKTFTSDFSGLGTRPTPASQSSQKFTTLNMGVSYMF